MKKGFKPHFSHYLAFLGKKISKADALSIAPVVVIILIALIIGCVPEKNYRILSFFFDGVPNPNKNQEVVVADTSTVENLSIATTPRNVKPEFYEHQPYKEEKCKEKFDRMFGGNKG